jgi:galactonate dehydratase
MKPMIDLLRLICVDVAPGTKWLFVNLVLESGESGWGESSLNGEEAAVTRAAEKLFPQLLGMDLSSAALFQRLPFSTLPEAAISSGVMQAFQDADARMAGLSLVERIGERRRDDVGLYANINRRTVNRSPAAMASSAVDAVQAGFQAVKIAPFDEVRPDLTHREMRQAMAVGVERIAVVREALGPGTRLMIDCHWRFNEGGALEMIDAVAPMALHWIECPVAETESHIDMIKRLRSKANAAGIRLAGLETKILTEGFLPFLRAGAYDVMMPDVKYAGGPTEMLRIAALLDQHNTIISPHNPTGPICHAHSLHLCSAFETLDLLEFQFDETPLFDRLIDGGLTPAEGGVVASDRSRIGLGVSLSDDPELSSEIVYSRRG